MLRSGLVGGASGCPWFAASRYEKIGAIFDIAFLSPPIVIKKLRTLWEEKGSSQAALDKISGVNSKLLSKYENERIVPTADTLRKIAQAPQISADYLIFVNAPKNGIIQLNGLELSGKFKEVETISLEDRTMIRNMIDALIIKRKVESVIRPKQKKDSWESRMQSTLDRLRARDKYYSEDELQQIMNKAVEEVRSEKKSAH